jgi:GNAT superfamily N-acetyltransferase
MGIQIQEVDTRSAPESLLAEMHEYYGPLRAEELPNDPPVPFERQAADWKNYREDEAAPRWLLRVDGEIAAVAVAFISLDQNLDNAFARIHVRPELRRQGLARRLAQPVLEFLSLDGRKRLSTYIIEGKPEGALLERLGLKPAYREKRSRLVVADVDMDLMTAWIKRASERASEYELLYMEMPFAEEAIDKYCELQFQMNTAPQEDFEQDDEVITPKIWRDMEEKMTLSRHELHTCVAIHKSTGDFVGSTTLNTDKLQPDQAWQWETVVHPDHRNKGLGRWLKAANMVKVAEERPLADRIDTWNAGSNEPMLNINIEMGFKQILVFDHWQGDLETARERLGP